MRDILGNAHLNSQRSQTLQQRISGQRHVLHVFSVGSDVLLHREESTHQDVRNETISLVLMTVNWSFYITVLSIY